MFYLIFFRLKIWFFYVICGNCCFDDGFCNFYILCVDKISICGYRCKVIVGSSFFFVVFEILGLYI